MVNTYESVHKKLKRVRGAAKDYTCELCNGKPALDWAYSANASEVRVQQGGNEAGRFFSTNLEDFFPACRKCHNIYDLANDLRKDSKSAVEAALLIVP